MFSVSANTIASSTKSPLVRTDVRCSRKMKHIGHGPSSGLLPLNLQSPAFGQRRSQAMRMKSASIICTAANVRCGAEQTQTVTRESSTITIAPIHGKEKSPDLDDGGSGLPPRDDGDGGGGGGGGGGGWSGGFFFFGFLAFLSLMQDQESEN